MPMHTLKTTATGNPDSQEMRVLNWLTQLQDMAEKTPDEATARSLRLAREVTAAVQSAYKKERERGADTIDATSALPTALAHALIAMSASLQSPMPLLDVVRVLASETFSTAENLAAIAEEQINLPPT